MRGPTLDLEAAMLHVWSWHSNDRGRKFAKFEEEVSEHARQLGAVLVMPVMVEPHVWLSVKYGEDAKFGQHTLNLLGP